MASDGNDRVSQVRFEETFIKSLLDKLKVGNRRGIHLNAIPGNARARLDLKELDQIRSGYADNFLRKLLSEEEFEFSINFDGIDLTALEEADKEGLHFISRKLNNIAIDDEDQFLESGIRNFGFGYPLLVRRDQADPEKVVKAPLLIWSLDISRSNRKMSHWTIKKNADHPVHINELLRSHILRDSQISIDALDDEKLEDNLIDSEELFNICENVLSQINTQSAKIKLDELKIETCPSGKKIDSLATDDAWIQWSGIFGIFTSRKESVIKRAEEILKSLSSFQEEKLILDKFQTSTISAVPTDPSKEEIINTLTDSEVKLIQGPPGTGKSQALTAIITNVLENGGTCLVVCEKRTALQVIFRNLEKIGLDGAAVLIEDVSKDRSAVVKKARSLVDDNRASSSYLDEASNRSYASKYTEFTRLRDSFNKKHHNERSSKIDEKSWKESVGLFLQYTREIDWNAVRPNLPKSYVLSAEEFDLLQSIIQDSAIAYRKLSPISTEPFRLVKNEVYVQPFSRGVADAFKAKIDESIESLESLKSLVNVPETVWEQNERSIFKIDETKTFLSEDESILGDLKQIQEYLDLVEGVILSDIPETLTSVLVSENSSFEDLESINLLSLESELKKFEEVAESNVKKIHDLLEQLRAKPSVACKSGQDHLSSFAGLFDYVQIETLLKIESKSQKTYSDILQKLHLIDVLDDKDLKMNFSEKLLGLFKGRDSLPAVKKYVVNNLRENKEAFYAKAAVSFSLEGGFEELKKKLKKEISETKKNIKFAKSVISLHKQIHASEMSFNAVSGTLLKLESLDFNSFNDVAVYLESLDKLANSLDALKNNVESYQTVHEWGYFYNSQQDDVKKVITGLIKSDIDTDKWLTAIRTWKYYYSLLGLEESASALNTDDSDLDRLMRLYDELKKEQLNVIRHKWKRHMGNRVASNFRLLYNLRRNNDYSRTNSLRKIINDDFEQFTSIFPVVLTNPLAADSMLPLELGLFDVVIFDEASQLRVEDTFTSFIRGKYKVIAGDKHQMPPSNYFQTAGDVSDNEEMTDEQLEDAELARSESLLDYAENLSFSKQSYLDYHYRSQHPALIDFSNVAFYGGNLVPFPEKFAYNPISFIEVNGNFIERVNEQEVEKVISILKEDIKSENGKYPSVGIATFNLPQRNRIIDRINIEMSLDSDFATKIEGIRDSENGFFIKNLENIQGDEMDVIIISATYGKDANGKFFERFGPLNLERAYKLLNVLVTRARDKVYICSSIPQEKISNYHSLLDQYKNNKKAILYAYLAYARAISAQQLDDAEAVKEELLKNSHDRPRVTNGKEGLIESPFEQEVYDCLIEKISPDLIVPQKRIGGFRVDFLIEINDKKVVIECDGKTYHSTNEAYAYDVFRQKELEALGYKVYRIWSTRWWHNHTQEINSLLAYLEQL